MVKILKIKNNEILTVAREKNALHLVEKQFEKDVVSYQKPQKPEKKNGTPVFRH